MNAPRIQRAPVKALFRLSFLEQITCSSTNKVYTLTSNNGQLPRDRFLAGLMLTVKFRVTQPGTGNATATLGDAPYSIINKIEVVGQHLIRRTDDVIVSLRGADLAQLQKIQTRASVVSSGTLSTTASATSDISFTLNVPFVPFLVHPAEIANYLVDAPNYTNLYLRIYWADANSLFSGQSGTIAFSAYGSSGGSPTIDVYTNEAMESVNNFRGFIPGRYSQYFKDAISSSVGTTNPEVRISDINRGGRFRAILLKTGVNATGVTSGNQAYASLSDSILTNIKVMRGTNRDVYNVKDFQTARAHDLLMRGGSAADTGYLMIDWVKHGSFAELFDATGLISGPSGDIDFFLKADVTTVSNAQATLICQEVLSLPSTLTPRA